MTQQDINDAIDQRLYDKKESNREFYTDLVEFFKLDANDKVVKKMYSLAWENGHAYGYYEVFGHFEDLVEVFKG